MSVVKAEKRRTNLYRFAPLGALGGFGAFAVASDASLLALACGAGAVAAGNRLWRGRQEAPYKELRRRIQDNLSELGKVAREDRIAAPQMKRLAGLQEGLVESWKLLPEDYAPILFEDLSAIVTEIEGTVLLARRRSALRRHLDGLDRRAVARRIKGLEKELAALEPDSELRKPFENALASRCRELESHDGILDGIGAINAQLENAESLLSSLRGEMLSVDAGLSAGSSGGLREDRLEHLRQQVSRFRRSLGEVSRSVEEPPAGDASATTRKLTEQVTVR
ncbi:hypothetical protein [Rubrobacter aplysinae]|uniref:hypothetical protein n=1 Tax=Rubrobacter aplysinae TaxID=909625 RepID=UPI00064BC977|nr:hypothetical protein [Rubrobacter aplysinae]